MNRKFIGLIIVIFLLQPYVKANEYDENRTSSSFNPYCLDIQASIEYEKADKNLNIIYKKVIAKIIPDNANSEDDKKILYQLKKSFIEAQRQWIIFRDSECSAWSNLNPIGSGRNQMTMQCFKDRTIDRTKQLDKWLQEL